MITIETDRLLLRTPEQRDAHDLFTYARKKHVGPSAGWKPHQNLEESISIIHHFIKNQDVWIIEHKKDKKAIGTIGLHKKIGNSSRDVGYVISDEYWNQGIATEACKAVIHYAFTTLELHELTCSHFSFNVASKKVILKCGFTYVDTTQGGFTRYDGQIMDLCNYKLTKDMYEEC